MVDVCFFFQAEDGIRDIGVTGVQTCALPIYAAYCRQGTCQNTNCWKVSIQFFLFLFCFLCVVGGHLKKTLKSISYWFLLFAVKNRFRAFKNS